MTTTRASGLTASWPSAAFLEGHCRQAAHLEAEAHGGSKAAAFSAALRCSSTTSISLSPSKTHAMTSGFSLPSSVAHNWTASSTTWPTSASSAGQSRALRSNSQAMAPAAATLGAEPAVEVVPTCPPECVEVAHVLADKAADVIAKYFRVPIDIQTKMDKSPVTIADETVEAEMRQIIRASFPTHAVLGEEGGLDLGTGEGEYIWVLDPIDGTASFITGKPLFGVLIALIHRGTPVLGVLDQPILKERWVGVRNDEEVVTTHNGRPIRTRDCSDLSSAYLYSTSPHLFQGASETAFTRVRTQVRRTNYGCDCYAFGLLALGFVDLVIEHGMKPWDYLALIPIVEGAGGVFTDWSGKPLRLDSTNPEDWVDECLAAGDRSAHQAALTALAWKGTSAEPSA